MSGVAWFAGRLRQCRLACCEKGLALVEFALLAPVFLLFVLGGLEIGYRVYAEAIVNGALREAARMASTGEYTGAQIDAKVTSMVHEFRDDAGVEIDKLSYSSFSGVGTSEPVTSGTIESGTYCYLDINDNDQWDEDQGAAGLGGPEDVIYYEVTMTYGTLMGFTKKTLGLPDLSTIQQNTIVSNEPFAAVVRTTPAPTCVS